MNAALPALLLLAFPVPQEAGTAGRVRFNRDVRPILSANCFSCHGPDEKNRKADLRLDLRQSALKAIVPGNVTESELLLRIAATGKKRMPPGKTGKRLKPDEIRLLRRWIEQGAGWEGHWAFLPPRRPAAPRIRHERWPRNEIDRFIAARLEQEGLEPSLEASREALLRRVSLDLTGLPPTIVEIDAFLADRSDRAYEKVVDRLLASKRYGERMALEWLDAARYADTHGLHVDSHRDMWLWRGWVIRAFNRNLPFDRFTIEQLAGDLLPNPTRRQLIATGFNRNHLISYQGSAIEEKVRVAYIVDRVNTTATVWMGLTFGCAQCHDHKFDPISQKEYYRFFALFNTIDEKAKGGREGNAVPVLRLGSAEQGARLSAIRGRMRESGTSKDKQSELKKLEKDLLKTIPSTMIMREMKKPRETFFLFRGEYNQRRERVDAGTPECLPPMAEGTPANRLGLAKWLVDPRHPLTSRVAVNRLWQMVFGSGIVISSEDFGSEGAWPVHPELLDWLAVEFVERGWDVKAMLKLMVTSATYRQTSSASPELVARDPDNRLRARGPRFRLSAELIRDNALAIGGLLREKIGGPSVKPYQPAGVWKAVAAQKGSYTAQSYRQDHGDALYRRSLYSFWKRLAPPPSMVAFDAPKRDVCCVRRQRTNTPLQALVLMNDPTFVEAGRALAQRMMKEGGTGDRDRVTHGFRLATARKPASRELEVLLALLDGQRDQFRADRKAALLLVGVGESSRDESLDPADLAAWTTVAGVLLNLDETITKE